MQNQNLTIPFNRSEVIPFTAFACGLSWAWWGALIFSNAQTFTNFSRMNADEAQTAQILAAVVMLTFLLVLVFAVYGMFKRAPYKKENP